MNRRVAYVFPVSHRFRAAFHEHMRTLLARHDVDYDYVHTTLDPEGKRDTVGIPWGTLTKAWTIRLGRRKLVYQAAWRACRHADLVIVQQENSLILNYILQILRPFSPRKVAFFGHGRNFQATAGDRGSERFKRFWVNKVDWWFAYTDRSAAVVAEAGFPRDRITVFNNAIDTSAISDQRNRISPEQTAALRNERFNGSDNVGLYIGGLYDLKRIDFLLESAKRVRAHVPDFQLVVIGGGPDLHLVESAARDNDWIHVMGPQFGDEKTRLASAARVFLMPGLVGLGVLDSFAYRTPIVTTRLPYHSPEFDYLQDGVNGVVVENPDDVVAYAGAVVQVLTDPLLHEQLTTGAREALSFYTMEAMAERFSQGVLAALDAPRKRG